MIENLKNIFLCSHTYRFILLYFFSKYENHQKHTKIENNQRTKLNKQIQRQLHSKNKKILSSYYFLKLEIKIQNTYTALNF